MRKLILAAVAGCMLQVTGFAADITPGYTFSSGEANITHTKLNNASAGTINTTFFSGKGSAGTDPNTAFTILIHNTTLDTFQKMPISSLLEHAELLEGRTVSTSLAVEDLILIWDFSAGAYRAISATNYFFGATETTAPTNDTRIPVLAGGVLSSVTLSNLIAGATVNSSPTNNDRWLTLTASGAVKSLSGESFVKNQTAATNWGNYVSVVWDGTRLRSAYETNKIDGLTSTNTAPKTNAAMAVLQDGVMQKLFLDSLRTFVMSNAARHYVLLRQTNSSGSDGQTLTASAGWETRTINDEQADTGSLAALTNSIFYLTAGTYRARITAPCHECGGHQARLAIVDSTATNTVIVGTSANSTASTSVTSESLIAGRFTITTNATLAVQHNVADNGTGGQAGSHGLGEVYTVVELWKESE